MYDPDFSELIKEINQNELEILHITTAEDGIIYETSRVGLTAEQFTICCNVLANNSSIKELIIRKFCLFPCDTDAIALFLKSSHTLSKLSIYDCYFVDDTINTIADALTMSTLKSLKLQDCFPFRDNHVAYFAESLKSNKFLRCCWMHGQKLTTACLDPVIKLLRDNFVISVEISQTGNDGKYLSYGELCYGEIKKFSDANFILQKVLEQYPNSIHQQIDAALALQRNPLSYDEIKKLSDANSLLQTVLEKHPNASQLINSALVNLRDDNIHSFYPLMRLAQYHVINNPEYAYQCYLKIPKNTQHFIKANEEICAILRQQLDRLDFEEKSAITSDSAAEKIELKKLLFTHTNIIAETDRSRMREAALLFSELCGEAFQIQPLLAEVKPDHETLLALAEQLRIKSIENKKLQDEVKTLQTKLEHAAMTNQTEENQPPPNHFGFYSS